MDSNPIGTSGQSLTPDCHERSNKYQLWKAHKKIFKNIFGSWFCLDGVQKNCELINECFMSSLRKTQKWFVPAVIFISSSITLGFFGHDWTKHDFLLTKASYFLSFPNHPACIFIKWIFFPLAKNEDIQVQTIFISNTNRSELRAAFNIGLFLNLLSPQVV